MVKSVHLRPDGPGYRSRRSARRPPPTSAPPPNPPPNPPRHRGGCPRARDCRSRPTPRPYPPRLPTRTATTTGPRRPGPAAVPAGPARRRAGRPAARASGPPPTAATAWSSWRGPRRAGSAPRADRTAPGRDEVVAAGEPELPKDRPVEIAPRVPARKRLTRGGQRASRIRSASSSCRSAASGSGSGPVPVPGQLGAVKAASARAISPAVQPDRRSLSETPGPRRGPRRLGPGRCDAPTRSSMSVSIRVIPSSRV